MSDTITSAVINADTTETETLDLDTTTEQTTVEGNAEPSSPALDEDALAAAIENARAEALEEARREHAATCQDLTETQTKLTGYEAENIALRRELDLLHVSHQTDVPAQFLQGNTREDMELFAAQLKAWRQDRPLPEPRKRGPLKSGANIQEDMLTTRQRATIEVRNAF